MFYAVNIYLSLYYPSAILWEMILRESPLYVAKQSLVGNKD